MEFANEGHTTTSASYDTWNTYRSNDPDSVKPSIFRDNNARFACRSSVVSLLTVYSIFSVFDNIGERRDEGDVERTPTDVTGDNIANNEASMMLMMMMIMMFSYHDVDVF